MSAPSICASRSGSIISVAWIGLAAAVLLLVVRTARLVFRPEKLATSHDAQAIDKAVET